MGASPVDAPIFLGKGKMNLIRNIFFITFASMVCGTAHSQVRDNDDLLAARGNGELTHEVFEARINRIPQEHQFAFIRDRERMEDVLDRLLLIMQLAFDARETGFDQNPEVIARMELAATEELAKAWMENYLTTVDPADYTAMAREDYLINQDTFITAETVDVSHILIKFDERSQEEALARALELEARLDEDPSQFDTFVIEYSQDPSKATNKGSFTNVKKGDMVPEFEESAFSLEVGQISAPVLSQFGYHIIRKNGITPARQRTFEQLQPALEKKMRDQHIERERKLYLTRLHEPETELSRESVERTIELLFGPEVLARYNEGVGAEQ